MAAASEADMSTAGNNGDDGANAAGSAPAVNDDSAQQQPAPGPGPEPEPEPEPPRPPEGALALFLTETTQRTVGLVQEKQSDPAPEPPQTALDPGGTLQWLDLETILKDIRFRGAISDFHCCAAELRALFEKLQATSSTTTTTKPEEAAAGAAAGAVVDSDTHPPIAPRLLLRRLVDDDYGDGSNFEAYLTVEATEKAIQALTAVAVEGEEKDQDQEDDNAEDDESRKGRRRRRESLGSAAEVEALQVRGTRDPVGLSAARKRRLFGHRCTFSDRSASQLFVSSQMECRPFKDTSHSLHRVITDAATQLPEMVATDAAMQVPDGCLAVNAGCQTMSMLKDESEADTQDPEETRAPFLQFLERATTIAEVALLQNEIVDVFVDEFSVAAKSEREQDEDGGAQVQELVELQSFAHLGYGKSKVVAAVAWRPQVRGEVAVSCVDFSTAAVLEGAEATTGGGSGGAVLIWASSDAINPRAALWAPCDVSSFVFHPTERNIVAGGLVNGQVVLWDIVRLDTDAGDSTSEPVAASQSPTTKIEYQYISQVEDSHRVPVRAIQWLPASFSSKDHQVPNKDLGKAAVKIRHPAQSSTFVTLAADGNLHFWDLRPKTGPGIGVSMSSFSSRPLILTPFYTMSLPRTDAAFGLSGTSLILAASVTGTPDPIVHCGSAEGDLVRADWKAVNSTAVLAHAATVCVVTRNPLLPEMVLTVGGWVFRIWAEDDLEKAVVTSPHSEAPLTAGAWSPTRAGVVFIGSAGTIAVWDVLDRSHAPSLLTTVSSDTITTLTFPPRLVDEASTGEAEGPQTTDSSTAASTSGPAVQQFLAVGDAKGVLRILQVPRALRKPVRDEVALVREYLQRCKASNSNTNIVASGDSGAVNAKDDVLASLQAKMTQCNSAAEYSKIESELVESLEVSS